MPLHQSVFPGICVPAELDALIAAGLLDDESWGNDECVRLTVPGQSGVCVWVQHTDPLMRSGARFTVSLYEDGDWLDNSEETDDPVALLRYLADHWDVRL